MIIFDQILTGLESIFAPHAQAVSEIGPIAVNRDLNGKVRLIAPETARENPQQFDLINQIAQQMEQRLSPHSFPAKAAVLYEPDVAAVCQNAPHFLLSGTDNVWVVDRLPTEGRWDLIKPVTHGARRIVFFSIKGGVGRSTAMAASAWALAQEGKKVLVLDLDLESPGLSTSLLPEEKRPASGIVDWMVEDLVDNGSRIVDNMLATSSLSHDGEIYVVPAHGKDPGEYIAKLGRVWMPKVGNHGQRESWSQRLNRLISDLEEKIKPDVIFIDSRSGIDEIAASCVSDLGASLILLFTVDGEQTWSGYRVLFEYWQRLGKATEIRERLQIVGAMVPDDERREAYFSGMRERAWNLFNPLYDEIQPGDLKDRFNFAMSDVLAPHYPWVIRWNLGFSAITSLHSRLTVVDARNVSLVFGELIDGTSQAINIVETSEEV
ncbi:KGGVGR-motif variant AAA ATPase [Erwinia pyrifoliae]|uniref:AAA family ATPase n=1 Tax=Erwinia pyrifoliae TaxID=79967 RepID=A0ABY5X590_ERWPY|nr:P-loop NTPase [Erwinia pyrifoliae]AUX71980.1 hypothetical protein CPI84_05485 [Erwinia pyrifoliae]MCA8877779.1 AAA family ATPase [Erwinia pyrifoliae]MCT2388215.1 AAA family ATPase [Erwinia pyrifoliae]MCU8586385.1 AAA family ATPase [Erwinia pyrifoliae]UWS30288.1 AAA family ATPase [Erwinia pyrifoliae]